MSTDWVPIQYAAEETGLTKNIISHYTRDGLETRRIDNPDKTRFGNARQIKAVRVQDVIEMHRSRARFRGEQKQHRDHCVLLDLDHFIRTCGMTFDQAVRRAADGNGLSESTVRQIVRDREDTQEVAA